MPATPLEDPLHVAVVPAQDTHFLSLETDLFEIGSENIGLCVYVHFDIYDEGTRLQNAIHFHCDIAICGNERLLAFCATRGRARCAISLGDLPSTSASRVWFEETIFQHAADPDHIHRLIAQRDRDAIGKTQLRLLWESKLLRLGEHPWRNLCTDGTPTSLPKEPQHSSRPAAESRGGRPFRTTNASATLAPNWLCACMSRFSRSDPPG